MQNTWQRSRKAKAVRQHVFGAGNAEFATEEAVAIKNLAKDRFRIRRIHVTFLHRRTRRKPSAPRDVSLEFGESSGVVLLHQPITVRAGEIEDVVRILIG